MTVTAGVRVREPGFTYIIIRKMIVVQSEKRRDGNGNVDAALPGTETSFGQDSTKQEVSPSLLIFQSGFSHLHHDQHPEE